MNVFHKVTIESLKKNRARTLVTIIGIMLSTALICSVTLSIYSFVCFGKEYTISESGDWHASAYPLSRSRVDSLRENSEVKDVFCLKADGYAQLDKKASVWADKMAIFAADSKCFDYLPIGLTAGRYPENSSEIVISSNFVYSYLSIANSRAGNTDDIIGSEIEFDMIADLSDTDILEDTDSEDGSGMENTVASVLSGEKRTYTIVGIYEDSYLNFLMEGFVREEGSYCCITKLDEEPGEGIYGAFFHMKKPSDTNSFLNREFNENDPENTGISSKANDELLMYSLSSGGAGFIGAVLLISVIVIGLIMFGSIALIYNAFAISVSERTKQFGLLSSIGATKKQVNRMIEFEAFSLSVIGIPLGVLLGIGGISVTFSALGSKFASITGLMAENNVKMEFHISWIVILISAIISLFTVRLSAWIPSVRAQRITAVEAIRQSSDIKAKNKNVRTPKILYKLFGLPGVLAQKYFKRSKKRYRATVVSLFMSIVLFISAYALTTYLVMEVENEYQTASYDISYDVFLESSEKADQLLEKFRSIPSADKVACSRKLYIHIGLDPDDLTSDIKEADSRYQSGDSTEYGQLMFVEDDIYRDYLKENGYSVDKYTDPDHPVALSFDKKEIYDIVNDRMNRYHLFNNSDKTITVTYDDTPKGYQIDFSYAGENGTIRFVKTAYGDPDAPDEIILTPEERDREISVNVGESIDKVPFFVNNNANEVAFIFPESFRDKLIDENKEYEDFSYTFLSKDHAACTKAVKKIIDAEGIYDGWVEDYAAEVEAIRNMIVIVKVFAYGFIILISLIAAANVFNTISTNVALRRREFAMLKSVGMGNKSLERMMNYECLLYGTKSLLYGLPVSFGVTYLIYRSFNVNSKTSFIIPWLAVVIAVVSVFAVVFATMIYSMRKVRRDNPIDALKNENL